MFENKNNHKRAINAYNKELGKKEQEKKDELKTGFLKLTDEKVDYGKIARFLLLLGKDEAVKVLKHLSPEEVNKISQEISRTKRVDKVEAEELLREFGFDREREAYRVRGGADAASEILTRAFGKEKADTYLKKAAPEIIGGPFSFLNDLSFEQLILLLKNESVQVMSLVLRYLEPSLTSRILEKIDKKTSSSIIKRIAKGGSVSNDVILGMEEVLREKIRNQGEMESLEIDGPSALAGILKYMDIDAEQNILQTLESEDEEMGRDIREKLFTIDTVLHMDRDDLAQILGDFKEKQIAIMFKVLDDEVKEKISHSLSSRRLMIVEEEIQILGEIRKSAADKEVKDFLKLLRRKEEEGAFIVIREEDELI